MELEDACVLAMSQLLAPPPEQTGLASKSKDRAALMPAAASNPLVRRVLHELFCDEMAVGQLSAVLQAATAAGGARAALAVARIVAIAAASGGANPMN